MNFDIDITTIAVIVFALALVSNFCWVTWKLDSLEQELRKTKQQRDDANFGRDYWMKEVGNAGCELEQWKKRALDAENELRKTSSAADEEIN